MSDHDRAPTPQGAAPQRSAQDQEAIDAFVHPTVMRINALAVDHPQAPLAELVSLLRAHPEDYDACMRRIHHFWGNQAAAACAIQVPHVTLPAPGAPGLAPPAAAAGGESGGPDVDVDTDPVSGERDVSTDIGGEGGHVTPHVTTTQAPGQQPELTGASVEVAGTRGNTHASVQVGADPSGAVTGQGEVTHRVSPNVAVGANAQVTNDHGEVHVAGGASLRLRLSDVTALRIAGGVDDQGMLNQEVALEILTDPSPRVPISDDAKRRLRFVIRAQEPTQVGQDPHAGLPNVSAGAVLTW